LLLIEEATVKSFLIFLVLMWASAGLAQAPPAAHKPLDKDQVMTLVTAGMDNAELAKKIEQLGIDFEPTEDYLQALRNAGAQDVLIHTLRAAKPEPMNRQQVVALVAGGVPSERATALVKQRGIDFVPDEKYLETLRVAGADEALIAALHEASAMMPGELVVATSPNAKVYLDGALAGRADSRGELNVKKVQSGAHALRVTLPAKRDFEQIITVAAGVASRIGAPLSDLPGRIVVSSTAGAEVYLDGRSRGKTDASGTLALADVTPGSHQLRVTAQGRKDYEQSLSVSAGQESAIQARLEDLPGRIRVRATPGANIFLDNSTIPWPLHACGDLTLPTSAGPHSIRVVADGQTEFQRVVTVPPGQEARLDAPRMDLARSTPGKHIDRSYRSVTTQNGLWYYIRFFPDGTVTYNGSQKSPADVEREFQEDKSKDCKWTYVYQMEGSTIRFPGEAMFGIIDWTATVRGNTLTVESVERGTGYRRQIIFQAVDFERAPTPRRRK